MQDLNRAEIDEIIACVKETVSALVLDSPAIFQQNKAVMDAWESLMASIKTYPRTIILPPSEAFYCFQYFGVDNDSDEPTIQNIHENYREPLLYIFRTGEATWDVDCFLWESGGISELAIFSTVIKLQDGFTLKEVCRINVP